MALIERQGTYGTYWGNTYDSSNTMTYEQMKVNAKYIYSYLLNKGWTANAICGMLGNMQSESAINPGRWQSDRVGGDSDGHGYSLVQWTPYTKYTNWCAENGYVDPSEMDVAIERILHEVENNLQWIATSKYNMSFKEFTQSTESPNYLAMVFIANYERPAEPNQPARGTQADSWYEYLTGETPIAPTISKKKKKFKWSVFTNQIRERRNI